MINFFIRHPTAANLMMLGFIGFGLYFLPNLIRETFPKTALDTVTVQAVYRGAAPADVAEAVCGRIEDAVDAVENLEELFCEARLGLATATLEMAEGADIARFQDDIKSEVDAIDDFPDGVDDPVIEITGRNDLVASLAVTGPMSVVDLKRHAEDVKRELQAIPELSEIEITGFADRQIRITLSQEALSRHGLSLDAVAQTVSRESVTRPIGEVEGDERTVLLRLTEERRAADDLADLIVLGTAGAELRLGDIAQIEPVFEDTDSKILLDGRRAALIRINKNRADDTLQAIDALDSYLETKRVQAPPGMVYLVTQDVSSIVRQRLDMLVTNAWQGILLVAAVLWLFFGTRFAFWVAMGLPVSFLGSLGLMALFGLSINMITMVGLLISIGLLMDDALVIAENISTRHRRGDDPATAAYRGTVEVLPGVALSFLTTVAVFGTLAFLGGDIGQVLKFVPIVLIMTLTVSLFEAFLILPNHLSHSLEGRDIGARVRAWTGARLDWLADRGAGALAALAARYRYLTVGVSVLLLLGAIAMLAGGAVKFQAFPELEGDTVVAQVLLPQGTPLSRTEAVVARLTGALDVLEAELGAREGDAPLIERVVVEHGKNTEAFESGAHVATVTIDLRSAEIRETRIDEFVNRWRDEVGAVPDVLALRFADFQIGVAGRPIEIRLTGLPPDGLKAASTDLATWLSGYEGVADVSDDLRPGKPELRLTLRPGARGMGLTASDVADQVAAAFLGRTASEIQVGPEGIEIDLRLVPGDRDTVADLEDFPIVLPDGAEVPLSVVADIVEDRGWARLNRLFGQTAVTVIGEVDRGAANVAEVLADTQARAFPDLRDRYPGLVLSIEGEQASSAETGADLANAMILGIAVVFLLLCFQFRSYALPPLVLSLIPLSLTGVVVGHFLTGFDLSMPSMVGYVSLAGVAINGAILMVEFIRHETADGHALIPAIRHAATRRFRAIFLSTLTTVVGLLPLLTETSVQAQVLQPLVISLTFGLVAAAALGLLVVPAILAILADFGWHSSDVKPRADMVE